MDEYKMLIDERKKFSGEWRKTRLRVLEGLKRLGKDIPLTAYTAEEEIKKATRTRREAGIGRY